MSQRNLTDADVQAIADVLEQRFVERVDQGLGRGLRGYLSKILLYVLLIVVVAGWLKGIRP